MLVAMELATMWSTHVHVRMCQCNAPSSSPLASHATKGDIGDFVIAGSRNVPIVSILTRLCCSLSKAGQQYVS